MKPKICAPIFPYESLHTRQQGYHVFPGDCPGGLRSRSSVREQTQNCLGRVLLICKFVCCLLNPRRHTGCSPSFSLVEAQTLANPTQSLVLPCPTKQVLLWVQAFGLPVYKQQPLRVDCLSASYLGNCSSRYRTCFPLFVQEGVTKHVKRQVKITS